MDLHKREASRANGPKRREEGRREGRAGQGGEGILGRKWTKEKKGFILFIYFPFHFIGFSELCAIKIIS